MFSQSTGDIDADASLESESTGLTLKQQMDVTGNFIRRFQATADARSNAIQLSCRLVDECEHDCENTIEEETRQTEQLVRDLRKRREQCAIDKERAIERLHQLKVESAKQKTSVTHKTEHLRTTIAGHSAAIRRRRELRRSIPLLADGVNSQAVVVAEVQSLMAGVDSKKERLEAAKKGVEDAKADLIASEDAIKTERQKNQLLKEELSEAEEELQTKQRQAVEAKEKQKKNLDLTIKVLNEIHAYDKYVYTPRSVLRCCSCLSLYLIACIVRVGLCDCSLQDPH